MVYSTPNAEFVGTEVISPVNLFKTFNKKEKLQAGNATGVNQIMFARMPCTNSQKSSDHSVA